MDHFDKAESIATNTLIIPNIPSCFFGCDDAMLLIHDTFVEYGRLYSFVPMKGFRRLMIIYQETASATKAKQDLDKSTLLWQETEPFPTMISLNKPNSDYVNEDKDYESLEIRVYYGQHYSIEVDKNRTLQVPQFERNLLISPPGSPFANWKQIEEDAPNQSILASDLVHAADISDYELDDDELVLESPTRLKPPSAVRIVCSKGSKQLDHLPSITVQDWDGHKPLSNVEQEVHESIIKPKTGYIPTSMPPV
ncbi:Calcipressin-domain-containing protein [Pilobolus umbonatus]|nr:Calcipressin-domain-containing protein [Pilobolus umbonatus]